MDLNGVFERAEPRCKGDSAPLVLVRGFWRRRGADSAGLVPMPARGGPAEAESGHIGPILHLFADFRGRIGRIGTNRALTPRVLVGGALAEAAKGGQIRI